MKQNLNEVHFSCRLKSYFLRFLWHAMTQFDDHVNVRNIVNVCMKVTIIHYIIVKQSDYFVINSIWNAPTDILIWLHLISSVVSFVLIIWSNDTANTSQIYRPKYSWRLINHTFVRSILAQNKKVSMFLLVIVVTSLLSSMYVFRMYLVQKLPLHNWE